MQLPHHVLAVAGRIDQQRQIRVRVHVDETWADDSPGRVDSPRGGDLREIAKRNNLLAVNADVASIPARTGAIDDDAPAMTRSRSMSDRQCTAEV